MSITFQNGMTAKLKELKTKFETTDLIIKKKCAVQLMTWTATEAPTPPIDEGFLRGSGSVFVGQEFIISDTKYPNRFLNRNSDDSNKDNIILGYNSPYAAAQHENHEPFGKKWQDGKTSAQAGNVSGKWLELHLRKDAGNIVKLYAEFMKKEF